MLSRSLASPLSRTWLHKRIFRRPAVRPQAIRRQQPLMQHSTNARRVLHRSLLLLARAACTAAFQPQRSARSNKRAAEYDEQHAASQEEHDDDGAVAPKPQPPGSGL